MKCLVCFAVTQEKRYFRAPSHAQVLVTGMGSKATAKALTKALETVRPDLVIAAGFAGGINPELSSGQLVLDANALGIHELDYSPIPSLFRGRILSVPKVLITPEEKAQVRAYSNADAVDMESATIRLLAEKHGISMLALRVISDAYDETLPLDFNRFMKQNGGLYLGKMMFYIARHPGIIPELLKFQKRVQESARQLGNALDLVLK